MDKSKPEQDTEPQSKVIQAEPEEGDWFFDMIIGFLRSPRWKAPVMSFLDEHCVVFDNEEENKLEFTKIHMDFCKIVEDLLAELLAELGVTNEQFVEACEKAAKNPLHNKIVSQIQAVDNFLAFKRLMVKRNQELEKQVVEMMKRKQAAGKSGTATEEEKKAEEPEVSDPIDLKGVEGGVETSGKNSLKGKEELKEVMRVAATIEKAEEEQMMKRALEESQKQAEEAKKAETEEEEMLRRVMEMSEQEEKERLAKLKRESDLSDQSTELSAKNSALTEKEQMLSKKEAELKQLMEQSRLKQQQEEEQLRKKEQELKEMQRKLEEQQKKSQLAQEEAVRKATETAALKQASQAEADAMMKAAEAEQAKKLAEAEAAKKLAEAELAKKVAEAEAQRKITEAEAAKLQAATASAQSVQVKAEKQEFVEVELKQTSKTIAQTSQQEVKTTPASMVALSETKVQQQEIAPKENKSGLPTIGANKSFLGGGLPQIGRSGAFEIDAEYMRKAQAELNKLNAIDDFVDPGATSNEPEDKRSMAEIAREKRMKAEQELEDAKNRPETVEERKARLAAQRDLLRKMKDQKRQEELDQFNQRLGDQKQAQGDDLYNQFKKMDAEKKNPDTDLERRRQIFKNVRKEIQRDENIKRENTYKEKMASLEQKSKLKEEEKKTREQELASQEAQRIASIKAKEAASTNFLDGIKSYKIE